MDRLDHIIKKVKKKIIAERQQSTGYGFVTNNNI